MKMMSLMKSYDICEWRCENVRKNFRTIYFTSIWDTFTYFRQMNIFYAIVRDSLTSF
jgi:hypothetical protein